MIGFFPEPYSDELLFSIVSRYAELTDYKYVEGLSRELFGASRRRFPVMLPAHLAALVARLPPGHHFTIKRLMNEHSLLPLFRPFISEQRYQRVQSDVASNQVSKAYGRLGINNYKASLKYLRYCPRCVEADRLTYQETYWHRLHQIRTIDLCSVHGTYLKDSQVLTSSTNRPVSLVTAEAALEHADLSFQAEEMEGFLTVQKRLAHAASWFLRHPTRIGYRADCRTYYLQRLLKRRLCTFAGTVKMTRLAMEFTSFYSTELLERMKCPVPAKGGHDNWLRKLLHHKECAIHPIFHLLFLGFLGAGPTALIKGALTTGPLRGVGNRDSKPFGSAPWPCLNPTAPHFKKDVVTDYEVSSTVMYPRLPRGVFRCSCGFAYSRTGPDNSPGDRYKIGNYVAFGDLWDNALKEMANNGGTIRKIARALETSGGTVVRQLARLEIRVALQKNLRVKPIDPRWISQDELERRRELKRSELLRIRNDHPQISRTEINKQHSSVYNWLHSHDREWLFANLPPKSPLAGRVRPRSKWLAKDAELAEAAIVEASRLRALPIRPVLISETAIACSLGILHVWSKRRLVLPLTAKKLCEVAETKEQLAVRRVEWAAGCFAEQGLSPTAQQIIQLSAIGWQSVKIPSVKAAIERAVATLEAQLAFDYSTSRAA